MGLTFGVDYGEPQPSPIAPTDHKLVFCNRARRYVIHSFGTNIGYSTEIFLRNTYPFIWLPASQVVDTILLLNPNYYNNGKTSQRFFGASYSFNAEHRDVVLYPLKVISSPVTSGAPDCLHPITLTNGVNLTYARHWSLGKNYYLANFTSGFWSNPKNQP